MIDIIICEDNNNQRKEIESIINSESKNLNSNIVLSTANPNEVLNYINNCKLNSFIYFLDIDLKSNMNGLELAKLIRKSDPRGYIIFLTAHAELTLLTFQYKVQAMDFIIKGDINVIKPRILDCIKEVYTTLNNAKIKNNNTIALDIGDNIIFYNLDDILFFETASKEHKIRIHTTTGQSEFYGTLKSIENIVSSDFYKTHRSYLINTKKIKSIDKSNLIVHMVNDEICYVSSRYLKCLIQKCLTN